MGLSAMVVPVLEAAGVGAAGGAGLSALTGGNIGKGALEGGLTGGGIGLGGEFLAPELGGTLGGALGGAAGGAAGAGVTGQNIGKGALEGGISGGIAGSLSPTTSTASASGAAPAGATAAPSGGGAPGGAGALVPDQGSGINITPSGTSASTGYDLSSNYAGSPLSSGNVGSLSPQSLGTAASSSGGANIGTQSLSSGTQNFLNNLSNSTPVNDALSPAVISASNAATPGGTDVALNQPSFWSNLTGSTAPVSQSLASAGQAAAGGGAQGGFGGLLGKGASSLGVGISGLGLAGDIIKGQQAIKGENQIKSEAAGLASQGAQLGNYLQTGTLPPGLQTALNQAADAAKARIQSKYASMGLEGSSAMQQELANVDMQTQGAAAQEALSLLNQGVNETGMASHLYQFMINNTLQQDQQLGQAISGFAQAAAGGNPVGAGRTITIGG